MAKSAWNAPKPRRTLRPKSPCCPLGGVGERSAIKDLATRILRAEEFQWYAWGPRPGRYLIAVPAAKEYPPITLTGGADRAITKVSTLTTHSMWHELGQFHSGAGKLQVTPVLNVCRMSKSELLRSMLGLAMKVGVFRYVATASESKRCRSSAPKCRRPNLVTHVINAART